MRQRRRNLSHKLKLCGYFDDSPAKPRIVTKLSVAPMVHLTYRGPPIEYTAADGI